MDLVGTFNIKVQKKFLNLWYKKMKIKLRDISITKQKQPKGARGEVLVGKIVEVSTNIIDEEFEVESKGEDT